MHTEERISKFYDDLKGMGLKHPVAEINRKTGYAKGYISEILRKIKEPSADFLTDFYNKFSISSQKTNDMDNYDLPIGDLKVTLTDYINLLKEQTRKAEEREREYLDIIKGKLNRIEFNSNELIEDLSALTTEVQAEHRAIMDTVDKAAKQPIGTTAAAADNVELAYHRERDKKGKKVTGK